MSHTQDCELCREPGGEVIHHGAKYRIVLVDDAAYPGFCRVIWNQHQQEITDLASVDRTALMDAVWRVEAALRKVMLPHKINLASLGNAVPHLHWHVIPRFADDAHFPQPVWGQSQRVTAADVLAERLALLPALRESVVRQMRHAL